MIEASYDESGILVRLLGAGPERSVESIPGELKVTGPPKTERKPDPNLYVGDKIVEFAGQPSREITVERIIYQDGKVLRHETWYTHYLYEAKILRVGTKPRPEPVTPPQKDEQPKGRSRRRPPVPAAGASPARRPAPPSSRSPRRARRACASGAASRR